MRDFASVRTDNRYVSVSADISVIGRYIGFADTQILYRYRLSVSADMKAHIGISVVTNKTGALWFYKKSKRFFLLNFEEN